MKRYKYIDTVLSHITDKRKKRKIEYELFDHLDEKEKWFESIGYGEEAATEKADAVMGDGDIVGEQLDMLNKHRFTKALPVVYSAFCLIITASLYYWLLVADDGWFVRCTFNGTDFSEFYIFIFISLLFIVNGVNMLLGIVKKRFFNLVSGFLCSEVIILFGPYFYIVQLFCIFDKKPFAEVFYNEFSVYNGMLFDLVIADGAGTLKKCLVYAVSLILLALFSAAFCVLIKTKLLKNSRLDLKIKNAAAALTALFVIISAVMLISGTVGTIAVKDNIKARVYDSYIEFEKGFVNNIDGFVGIEEKEAQEKLAEIAEIVKHRKDLHLNFKPTELFNYYYIVSSETVNITDDGELDGFEMSTECLLLNPFALHFELYDMHSDKSIADVTSLDEAPLPADIHFVSSSGETYLILYYRTENKAPYLRFDYDEKAKRFVLTENTENRKTIKTTLTNEQINIFKANLPIYYPYSKYNAKLWYQIHGAYKSVINDYYVIEYSYCYYNRDGEMNTNDDVVIEEGKLGLVSKVMFSDDDCQFYYYENCGMEIDSTNFNGMYNNPVSTGDLVNEIKDCYHRESITKIKKKNLVKNLETIIHDYDCSYYQLGEKYFAAFGNYNYESESSVEYIGDDMYYLSGGYDKLPRILYRLKDYKKHAVSHPQESAINKGEIIAENVADFTVNNSVITYLTTDGKLYNYSDKLTLIMSEVLSFSAQKDYIVAVKCDDKLYFIGESKYGESGKITDSIDKPTVIAKDVESVCTAPHTLAYITLGGTLYTQGDNSAHLIGNGKSGGIVTAPYKVMDNCSLVEFTGAYFVAYKRDTSAYYWGDSSVAPEEYREQPIRSGLPDPVKWR